MHDCLEYPWLIARAYERREVAQRCIKLQYILQTGQCTNQITQIVPLGYITIDFQGKCVGGVHNKYFFTSLTLPFYKTRVFNFIFWKEELLRKP